MSIRVETKSDIDDIWKINTEAFETKEEATIVNALRNSDVTNISLVYEQNGELGGHILFTTVELIGDTSDLKLMGLAPMAVIPKLQNKGVGSSLIKAGIQQCINDGYDAIIVLGHPDYYPKFGFVPSVKYGIKSEYDVPDNVFMVLELKKNSLKGKQGVIKYHEEFNCV